MTSPYALPFALTDRYRDLHRSDEGEEHADGVGRAAAGAKTRFVADMNVRLICTNCRTDPPNIIEVFASGDLVCGECGLVMGDKIIDTRSEWRTFANEEGDDPSRVGSSSSPLMDGIEAQLETRIGHGGGSTDAAQALQRTMNRGASSSSRVILDAFEDIQSKCDHIHLPRPVVETAKLMFRQVERDQILRGKNREAIAVAVIFCACKANRVPRTFPEICQLSQVGQREIKRCFRTMQAAYGYSMLRAPDSSGTSSIRATIATDLIPRFCNHLALGAKASKVTEEVAELLRDKDLLASRHPKTIAATCIYLVTRLLGQDVSANKVGQVAGVSAATIKGSGRTLVSLRDDWLSPAFMSKYPELDVARLP